MFCSKCGNRLEDNATFCSNCGTAVAPQAAQEPIVQQPVQPQRTALPMGWYKFLIYFSLWAAAIVNILSAIPMLTGSQYGTQQEVDLVYAMFPKLQTLDVICGILALALGIFAIYARFQLAGYKKKGPMWLFVLYIGNILFGLIYIIGCNSVLPEYVLSEVNFSSMYSSLVISAIFLFVNISYFKTRAHLFVN